MIVLRDRLVEMETQGSWRPHSQVTTNYWMLLHRHILESGIDLDASMTEEAARLAAKTIAERAVDEYALSHTLSDGEREWLTLYLMARVIPTVRI